MAQYVRACIYQEYPRKASQKSYVLRRVRLLRRLITRFKLNGCLCVRQITPFSVFLKEKITSKSKNKNVCVGECFLSIHRGSSVCVDNKCVCVCFFFKA